MADTVTLSTLRTLVRDRAEMPSGSNGEGFVTDRELTYYVNAAAAELYDILIDEYEDQYTEVSYFSITSGSQQNLTAGFLKLMGLDFQVGANWIEVPRFEWKDRNRTSSPSNFAAQGYCADRQYRVVGTAIRIIPADNATGVYRLWYVPSFTAMSADTDALEALQGWYEYVVVDAAIRCLNKEESDVSVLMAEKAALKQRIQLAAANRDANSPQVAGGMWDLDPRAPYAGPWVA